MDGPIHYSLEVKFKRVGTAYVTFKLLDRVGVAYRVQVFRVNVRPDAVNSAKPTISPGKETRNQDCLFVKPGELVGIGYECGGEGDAGGWVLYGIRYDDGCAGGGGGWHGRPRVRLVYYA
jgi:hypothetical protein